MSGPLNFSLSTTALAVTGETTSPDEVREFAATLVRLADVMAAWNTRTQEKEHD